MTVAVKNPERRDYRDANGKRLPSVTTILGATLGWSKDGLIAWAYRLGCEATATQAKAFMETMGAQPPDEDDADAWAERAKQERAHNKKRDAAADAGALAHAMIDAHLKGEAFGVLSDEDTAEKASRAYARWLRWYLACAPVVIAAEKQMTDQGTGFGGTLDAVVRINGRVTLADWKTSKTAHDDVILQLGGYLHLWRLLGGEPIEHAVVVNCPVDGDLHVIDIPLAQLELGMTAFMMLTCVYKNRANLALMKDEK